MTRVHDNVKGGDDVQVHVRVNDHAYVYDQVYAHVLALRSHSCKQDSCVELPVACLFD